MQPTQRRLANAIRALAMDAVEAANSGHPGMPMGMADAATALFTKVMKYDPADPKWPDRDRFVLSAGHGSMLQYSLMHFTGYQSVSVRFSGPPNAARWHIALMPALTNRGRCSWRTASTSGSSTASSTSAFQS